MVLKKVLIVHTNSNILKSYQAIVKKMRNFKDNGLLNKTAKFEHYAVVSFRALDF